MMCSPKCRYWMSGSNKCIECTKSSERHRYNTNELSNKGATFISLDNGKVDDDKQQFSREGYRIEPSFLARKAPSDPPKPIEGINESAYEYMKRFVFEIASLDKLERDLFFYFVKNGNKSGIKTSFACENRISNGTVTKINRMMTEKSPIVKAFILALCGSVTGPHGRTPNPKGKKLKKTAKAKPAEQREDYMMQGFLSI